MVNPFLNCCRSALISKCIAPPSNANVSLTPLAKMSVSNPGLVVENFKEKQAMLGLFYLNTLFVSVVGRKGLIEKVVFPFAFYLTDNGV